MSSMPAAGFVLAPETAGWLVGREGLACLQETTAELEQGSDELAVATRLRSSGVPPERARALLDAAQARRRARERYDDADALVLTTAGLEQASHPAASAARAARFAAAGAEAVTDLCAGLGGDALALAERVAGVTAVDRDPARLTLLEHNARVRGVAVTTEVADVLQRPVDPAAFVHADPGRRRDGRRLRHLAEYQPGVPALATHTRGAAGSGIVVSPAVGLADPGLPEDAELEFVQLGRQLLEASIWRGALRHEGAVARATLLDTGASVSRAGPPVEPPLGDVGELLLEPAPAAVRARVHGQLAAAVGARRLATRRALLTAEHRPAGPWFQVWLVEAVLALRVKPIRRWLREHDDEPVEIATHGVDADPDQWWRRLGRPPRGPRGRRLHLVRLDDGARCIVTRSVA